MDNRFEQSTSKHSKAKAQTIPRKKFHTGPYERQPCKSKTNCGSENIPSENNIEVLSLLKIILKKQESLERRIVQIEKSVFNTESVILKDIIQRSEIMTQKKNTRERKVMVKRVHSGGRMTGEIEDVSIDEIAGGFPLVTIDALMEVEQKLNMKQYHQTMVAYIYKLKNLSNSVDGVLRRIFTDTLIKSFNWDGRWGKKPLNSLNIINKILFELFQVEGRKTFERNVKKYVELSRNRMKQKIRLQAKTKQRQELLGYP